MSLESTISKDDSRKNINTGNRSPSSKYSSKSCNPERACKKHVKIAPGGPTFYDDESKKGLQVYSSLSRLVVANPLNRHCYLQNTALNRHWREEGSPCLVWYDYVSHLITQRTQLTLMRKLVNQKYYTTQFLYKLQQFLSLQQEVYSEISLYQSYTLDGETSKLPKLNILCKQIVSLLNDLESCSIHNLNKSLDRSINLSGFILRSRNLYEQITFDLVQCAHNTRRIILNEIRFCYLFANYRSRIYSIVENVIKFNDIAFHPVLVGREGDLVILLEEVVMCNVEVAASYIARSYHYKIVSAHYKSVPLLQNTEKISDVMCSVQKCQLCTKLGHGLHKYCTNKCGAFLDAMSMMMQGAGDNRVACRTDNCTSRYVEEQLSRHLLLALYCQAASSVFYENSLACGDKSSVLVHEQFYDLTRKTRDQFCEQTRKSRRKWDDNFTNVIYTCTQRGLPNSWAAVGDIGGFESTVYKLDTSYYSMITCDFAKELKVAQLAALINNGIEEVLGQIKLDVINKNINDTLTRHFNQLSYLVLTDFSASKEQIKLSLAYTQYLNHVLRYIYTGYKRVLTKLMSTKDYSLLFANATTLFEFCVYLESLNKQLPVAGELKVPHYLSHAYSKALVSTEENIELLKDTLNWMLEDFAPLATSTIRQVLVDSLLPASYWKQEIYETCLSPCMAQVADTITLMSTASSTLPEPYLTRVHHVLMNSAAQLIGKHIVNNKKINFSSRGAIKLECDVQQILNLVKACPVSSEVVLSSPDVLTLRNDLNALVLKRNKSGSVKSGCSCNNQGNWKRLSAPQLCSNCSSSNSTPSSLKPPTVNAREIFSDSEVGADISVSNHLKMRQKKLVKERLEVTM